RSPALSALRRMGPLDVQEGGSEAPGLSMAGAAIKNAVADAVSRGNSCREGGDWSAAREAYSRALALDPTLQRIWVQLGHTAKETGNHLEAEAAYRKAIALNPEDRSE